MDEEQKEKIKCVASELSAAFVWASTIKGHNFWEEVSEELEKLAEGKGWKEIVFTHKPQNPKLKFTQKELELLGKILDMQRDSMATKLIHLEALMQSENIKKIHNRHFKAWEFMTELSEKIDKLRGIE